MVEFAHESWYHHLATFHLVGSKETRKKHTMSRIETLMRPAGSYPQGSESVRVEQVTEGIVLYHNVVSEAEEIEVGLPLPHSLLFVLL